MREYPALTDLRQVVARSAYTQLRRSLFVVAAIVLVLLLVCVVPVLTIVIGLAAGTWSLAVPGGAGWLIMTASYLPMLRFYRLNRWCALSLPAVDLLYAAMTLDSARLHLTGRGAAWKGRVAGG